MNPPAYWRANKNWSKWLGRRGIVIASTYIRVAADNQESLAPYSFIIIDFNGEKAEFMGVGHEQLSVGDTVECVLRRMSDSESHEIIEYGIKVKKI